MMRPRRNAALALCSLCMLLAAAGRADARQTAAPAYGSFNVTPKPEEVKSNPAAAAATSRVRIRVKDAEGKPVQRKRFYLLSGSAEAAGLDWPSVPARDEFFGGASPELREWLGRHDCDTLYCPEYEAAFGSAKEVVPEFRRAYAEGLRRYKSPRLALRWMTVNFPLKEIRTRYYDGKKDWLSRAAQKAGSVASVMTDEKGEAYFVGVRLGSYHVSNLIPLGVGRIVWDAPVSVPPLLPGKLHSVTVELTAKPR